MEVVANFVWSNSRIIFKILLVKLESMGNKMKINAGATKEGTGDNQFIPRVHTYHLPEEVDLNYLLT